MSGRAPVNVNQLRQGTSVTLQSMAEMIELGKTRGTLILIGQALNESQSPGVNSFCFLRSSASQSVYQLSMC